MTHQPPPGTLTSATGLSVHFGGGLSLRKRIAGAPKQPVRAVDGVDLAVAPGEVLGIIGESGSGKSTLGRALIGLVPPTNGSVSFDGLDLAELSRGQLRRLRSRMQMVFQDPHASLSPTMTIGDAIAHPLRIHGVVNSKSEQRERVIEVLDRVGLSPAESFIDRYPGDLSGGQKQRAVIARAIVLSPDLIVADEPIAALDMSVRAKILGLLTDLKSELGLSFVYITHDLASAQFFCDRIAIMYLGRIVETGTVDEVFSNPRHPYTQALLRAVPRADPDAVVERDIPRGEVPDAMNRPRGCSFHPRCPVATPICGWESRDLASFFEQRWAQIDLETFARESAILGDLAAAARGAADEIRITPGREFGPDAVLEVLRTARHETPDDPFWGGVTSIAAGTDEVVVRFASSVDPRLIPIASRNTTHPTSVACVLYDAVP